jgi:hypothetical protein
LGCPKKQLIAHLNDSILKPRQKGLVDPKQLCRSDLVESTPLPRETQHVSV